MDLKFFEVSQLYHHLHEKRYNELIYNVLHWWFVIFLYFYGTYNTLIPVHTAYRMGWYLIYLWVGFSTYRTGRHILCRIVCGKKRCPAKLFFRHICSASMSLLLNWKWFSGRNFYRIEKKKPSICSIFQLE
jgi:hypothetical protein